jgi:hypothetical protein
VTGQKVEAYLTSRIDHQLTSMQRLCRRFGSFVIESWTPGVRTPLFKRPQIIGLDLRGNALGALSSTNKVHAPHSIM